MEQAPGSVQTRPTVPTPLPGLGLYGAEDASDDDETASVASGSGEIAATTGMLQVNGSVNGAVGSIASGVASMTTHMQHPASAMTAAETPPSSVTSHSGMATDAATAAAAVAAAVATSDVVATPADSSSAATPAVEGPSTPSKPGVSSPEERTLGASTGSAGLDVSVEDSEPGGGKRKRRLSILSDSVERKQKRRQSIGDGRLQWAENLEHRFEVGRTVYPEDFYSAARPDVVQHNARSAAIESWLDGLNRDPAVIANLIQQGVLRGTPDGYEVVPQHEIQRPGQAGDSKPPVEEEVEAEAIAAAEEVVAEAEEVVAEAEAVVAAPQPVGEDGATETGDTKDLSDEAAEAAALLASLEQEFLTETGAASIATSENGPTTSNGSVDNNKAAPSNAASVEREPENGVDSSGEARSRRPVLAGSSWVQVETAPSVPGEVVHAHGDEGPMATADSSSAPASSVEPGRKVLDRRECFACHQVILLYGSPQAPQPGQPAYDAGSEAYVCRVCDGDADGRAATCCPTCYHQKSHQHFLFPIESS